MKKKKESRERNHYSACDACNKRQGAVDPKPSKCITMTMGTCPYCKKENQTLIPWVDYDWPNDKTLTAHARAQRD